MKKIIVTAALLLSGFIFQQVAAQVKVSINIGVQPVWGPVGYDHVEYYYMPDIDAYYHVPNHQYIYMDRGQWIFASTLPARFHYNLYSGYKVVINEPRPYRNAEMYRTQYSNYRGNHSQEIIRNSRDPRYYENNNRRRDRNHGENNNHDEHDNHDNNDEHNNNE